MGRKRESGDGYVPRRPVEYTVTLQNAAGEPITTDNPALRAAVSHMWAQWMAYERDHRTED